MSFHPLGKFAFGLLHKGLKGKELSHALDGEIERRHADKEKKAGPKSPSQGKGAKGAKKGKK